MVCWWSEGGGRDSPSSTGQSEQQKQVVQQVVQHVVQNVAPAIVKEVTQETKGKITNCFKPISKEQNLKNSKSDQSKI